MMSFRIRDRRIAAVMAAILAFTIIFMTGCSEPVFVEKKTMPAREHVEVDTAENADTAEKADANANADAAGISLENEVEEAAENDAETETETEPETAAVPEDKTIRLAFSGDIYLSQYVLDAYDRAGGISGVLDEGFRNAINDADLFIANEEFPFSERGSQAPDKQFTFRLPSSRLHIMNEIGVDVVTLANNHTLDFGQDALADTLTNLDGVGIGHTGAGNNLSEASEPVYVDVKGKRIAILGATRVMPVGSWAAGASHPGLFSAYEPAAVEAKIREIRPNCDYLILMIHWGIERNTSPESYQVNDGRRYIDAGADMVVGSHPHVLQGMEFYKGKPVLYSLGNFIFGSSIPSTMLIEAEIDEDGAIALKALPGKSSGGYTQSLSAGNSAGESILKDFQAMSKGITVDSDGSIRPGTP